MSATPLRIRARRMSFALPRCGSKLGGAAESSSSPRSPCWRRWCCSASSSRCSGRTRSICISTCTRARSARWFSWQNTLHARRAADPDGALHRAAGAARPGDHRRRGRAGARRRCAAAGAALALPGAPPLVRRCRDGARRHDRRRRCGSRWPARCASIAASTRRSRACCWPISRIALLNHLVEGPLRDPASLNKPSTPRDRRRQHDRQHSGHRRALGARVRHRRLRRLPTF